MALGTVCVRSLKSMHAVSLAAALLALFVPARALAWGNNANRLVVNRAIDTLPQDIRGFFDANRSILLQHVNDPFGALGPVGSAEKSPTAERERRNQYLFLDKYGRFPFEALPRTYKAAVTKFGKSKLESNGLLPWQIGVYSQKLTEALRDAKWEDAKLYAAILASYVAASHDPFNTTDNFDGHLSAQNGVNDRFGTALVDRYSSYFFMRPNDAAYIADPTDHAFEDCLSAHSSLETVLYADRQARRNLNSYTDEYYDHFYNQAGAVLIRQLSDAATAVGSYWFTAWKNAGQPQLPH